MITSAFYVQKYQNNKQNGQNDSLKCHLNARPITSGKIKSGKLGQLTWVPTTLSASLEKTYISLTLAMCLNTILIHHFSSTTAGTLLLWTKKERLDG